MIGNRTQPDFHGRLTESAHRELMFALKTYRRPAILFRTFFQVLGYMVFGLLWITACSFGLALRDAVTGKRPISQQVQSWRREIAKKRPGHVPGAPAL